MTQETHDYFVKYSTNTFHKIFKTKAKAYQTLTPIDFFYNCYSADIDTETLQKQIFRNIFAEYYKFVGKRQQLLITVKGEVYEKKCKQCGKTKDVSLFHKDHDKRYNFHYYKPNCKDCVSIIKISYRTQNKINQRNRAVKILNWWQLLDINNQRRLMKKFNIEKKPIKKDILKMYSFHKKTLNHFPDIGNMVA